MSSKASKLITGLLILGVVAFCWWKFRPRKAGNEATTGEAASAAVEPVAEPLIPPAAAEDSSALKNRLAEEIRARQRLEAEAAALRAQAAALKTNTITPVAKAQEIGKRTGTILPALIEIEALSKKTDALTPEEKRRLLQLQRDHAQLLGALPEITAFQDNPEAYGSFFGNMFQQAAGLTDAQAAQIQEFMQQRAVLMNQQELNSAKEPTDPKLEEAWEERRDKFNEQTAEGLKGVLPPGAAEKVNFGPELMEFLEMDFDKLVPKTPEKPAL
jgi:hypothetical protein